jgi:hypothetical protein
MPTLANARHEAFAQARARGVRKEDAYEDAGFAPGNDHAGRLDTRPEVAERVAELRGQQTEIAESATHAVIAALLRVAKAGEAATTPAAIKEIRLTFLAINQLRAAMDLDRDKARRGIARGF